MTPRSRRGATDNSTLDISHLGQLFAGDQVEAATQVLGWDDKRLHVFHTVARTGEDEPVALAEHMLMYVDGAAGRAAPS